MGKFKAPQEWFEQAGYDLDTARAMFRTGRYIYTVFMCHLAVEKALKGLYAKGFNKDSPKTHDLNYLCEKIKLDLTQELQEFMDTLNDLSVPTRYPDELTKILKQYRKKNTAKVLKKTKGLLRCLEKRL